MWRGYGLGIFEIKEEGKQMNPTTDELIKEGLNSFTLRLDKIDEKIRNLNHDFKELEEINFTWKRQDMKVIDEMLLEVRKIKQALEEKK